MKSAPNGLNVVGIVVQAAPGKAEAVRTALALMAGVDVHAEAEDGRIVATAIDTGETLAIDQLAAMNRTPGVVSTMIAYHQIEHPPASVAAAPCGCSPTDPSCTSEKRA